jgi:uncharacterized membrane protein YuzA (DUF378 family)
MGIFDDEMLNMIVYAVTAVAAINWGLVGLTDTNLLADTLGLTGNSLNLAYLAIGAAGLLDAIGLLDDLDVVDISLSVATIAGALIALTVVGGAVGGLMVAPAAAAAPGAASGPTLDVTTDAANFSDVGNDTIADRTLMVDNSTRSIYVEIDNSSGNATAPVNVTVLAIDDQDVQSQVDKVQISAGSGSELYEYQNVSPDAHPEYRVLVEGNSTDVEPQTVTIGTVSEVAGGGGAFSLGGDVTIGGVSLPFGLALAAAALGVLLLVNRGS